MGKSEEENNTKNEDLSSDARATKNRGTEDRGLSSGIPRGIVFDKDPFHEDNYPEYGVELKPRGKGRPWDFNQELFSNKIELIRDNTSTLYNFGALLVTMMKQIQREGQVYYWGWLKVKKQVEKQLELMREYKERKMVPFVRMGNFSDDTPVGRKNKPAGKSDQLYKKMGTTNCSTAVLDALYRALGGRINKNGKITRVGVVNGVPLSDRMYSGFPKNFQGPGWVEALEQYELGYRVRFEDLRFGDIISMPGHRMIYLETLEHNRKGWPTLIKTIESKPPTGEEIQIHEGRKPRKNGWQAARIFDILSKNFVILLVIKISYTFLMI